MREKHISENCNNKTQFAINYGNHLTVRFMVHISSNCNKKEDKISTFATEVWNKETHEFIECSQMNIVTMDQSRSCKQKQSDFNKKYFLNEGGKSPHLAKA